MLVSNDPHLIEHARYLATQARDPAPHYQHSVIGYNYRLSNVLAGIGRGQLRVLPQRIAARKLNREFYQESLGSLPGVDFAPSSPDGDPNYWLTCITIDAKRFGTGREDVRLALDAASIESRPVWKPMHLQPAFSGCRVRGGEVSEEIFGQGLCLPSGSNLNEADLSRICEVVHRVYCGRGL